MRLFYNYRYKENCKPYKSIHKLTYTMSTPESRFFVHFFLNFILFSL